MPDLNDDALKRLLGDDPVATSVSVRIRQDEQTLASLERHFTSLRKEAEGIAKALKDAGVSMKDLNGFAGGNQATVGRIGNTTVPLSIGETAHTRTKTITDINSANGKTGITDIGAGKMSKLASGAVQGAQMLDAGIQAMDRRIERGYQYSLSADRVNMLFQQMKGMSQQAIQDTYRQPLTQYKLGVGGINALLGLEASTGIGAGQQAAAVEALRISSGFSINAQQAAGVLGGLASPQVANRMFMMTGMSLVKPGGGYRPMDELMRNLVRSQGLTDPRILKGAMAPGSVTRANLGNIGVTGEFQTQLLQYAQQNLAFQQKGGSGMYDPSNKAHQKLMGISDNFAMQQEETDRTRIAREEQFYSRQADNFADLEKQTQSLTRALGGLEDVLSGLFGFRTSTKGFSDIGGMLGGILGGIGGSFLPIPGGTFIGAMGGSQLGRFIGSIIPSGDFISADRAERIAQRADTAVSRNVSRPTTAGMSADAAEHWIQSGAATAPTRGTTASVGPRRSSSIRRTADAAERAAVQRRNADFQRYMGMSGGQGGELLREYTMAYTPFIYKGKRTTLGEALRQPEFLNANPEIVRAIQDAAILASQEGTLIGVKSGWRSYSEQVSLFLQNYKQVDYPTGTAWNGKYYEKYPHGVDVAIPGSDDALHQMGLAFDVDGDISWLAKNAKKVGLMNPTADEPWHFQLDTHGKTGSQFNKLNNFKPLGVGYNPNGVGYSAGTSEASIIQALSERGLKSVAWTKDVNGKRQQMGMEFVPVMGGGVENINDLKSLTTGIYSDMGMLGSILGTLSPNAPVNVHPNTNITEAELIAKYPGLNLSIDENGRLSIDSLLNILQMAGFKDSALIEFASIARRESGGKFWELNPNNEHSIGLFQLNVADSANLRFIESLGYKPQDLYDPIINAKVAYAMYSRGGGGNVSPWGPYKGMHHMTGTNWESVAREAKNLGYVSSDFQYAGPQNSPGLTYYRTIKEWEQSRGINTGGTQGSQGSFSGVSIPMGDYIKPKEDRVRDAPKRIPSTSQTRSSDSSTTLAPVLNGGHTITIAPTININTSGNNIEQDLENMARKVAMMLEREVSKTMIRRS